MVNPRTWPIFRRFSWVEADKQEEVVNADFRAVFQTDQGARVLAQIMTDAEMFHATITTDRVNRDMIDGKRELALSIVERAGFMNEELPVALLTDNLKTAKKENRNERDAEYEPDAPGPVFIQPLGD